MCGLPVVGMGLYSWKQVYKQSAIGDSASLVNLISQYIYIYIYIYVYLYIYIYIYQNWSTILSPLSSFIPFTSLYSVFLSYQSYSRPSLTSHLQIARPNRSFYHVVHHVTPSPISNSPVSDPLISLFIKNMKTHPIYVNVSQSILTGHFIAYAYRCMYYSDPEFTSEFTFAISLTIV